MSFVTAGLCAAVTSNIALRPVSTSSKRIKVAMMTVPVRPIHLAFVRIVVLIAHGEMTASVCNKFV